MEPLLGVGWTLNLEMFFYLLFSGVLVLSRRRAPLIVSVTLVAMKLASLRFANPFLAFYAQNYTSCFVFGIFVFYAWHMLPLKLFTRYRLITVLVSSAIVLGFVTAHAAFADGSHVPLHFMAALVVLAALAFHSSGLRSDWKPAAALGDASYALYLIHPAVLETIRPVGNKWPLFNFQTSVSGRAIAVGLSCLVAVGTFRFVETPMLRWLRRQTATRRKTASTPAVADSLSQTMCDNRASAVPNPEGIPLRRP